MKKLLLALALCLISFSSALAANVIKTYQDAYGHHIRGTWDSSAAKSCLAQVNGEVYKAWSIVITGTATVSIKASADNQTSFNTLITYTQASTAPIGGEAQDNYTDFCIEVTVCTACTVAATISTGYAQVRPIP